MTTEMYPYATVNDVKLHLSGKVGKLPNLKTAEVRYYLTSACVQVHNDLSRAYVVPFQNSSGGDFTTLPQDTRVAIRDIVVYYCSYLILKLHFGNNESFNNASEYADSEMEVYRAKKSLYMGENADGIYKAIPLAQLMLNPHASFRAVAGLPAGKVGSVGQATPNQGNIVQGKVQNLHKSMWNGRTYRRW